MSLEDKARNTVDTARGKAKDAVHSGLPDEKKRKK